MSSPSETSTAATSTSKTFVDNGDDECKLAVIEAVHDVEEESAPIQDSARQPSPAVKTKTKSKNRAPFKCLIGSVENRQPQSSIKAKSTKNKGPSTSTTVVAIIEQDETTSTSTNQLGTNSDSIISLDTSSAAGNFRIILLS